MELYETSLLSDGNKLAYYRFGSGALTTDSFGNGNTLTNNNTVGEIANGRFGHAADFGPSNTNKYFSLGHDFGRNGQTVSISLWFKMTNPSDDIEFFNLSDETTDTHLYGGYSGTQIYVQRHRVGVAIDTINVNKTMDTEWHHFVVTLQNGGSGGPMILYLDGVNIGNTTVAGTNGSVGTSDLFHIGRGPASKYMKGYMDDVGAFSRVLTAAEVYQLYLSPGNFLAFL